MKKIVVLENIRSAYNVGNVIRTADALGRDVWLTGYTPTPDQVEKVRKTSLGSEHSVEVRSFWNHADAYTYLPREDCMRLAAEITSSSKSLADFSPQMDGLAYLIVVMGNEKTGVLPETLEIVDQAVHIPMKGLKESLNVGQAAAIVMWELGKNT